MSNRLVHTMYMVMLVALGLVSQEVSAMSWRDVYDAWGRGPSASQAVNAQVITPAASSWWKVPSMPSMPLWSSVKSAPGRALSGISSGAGSLYGKLPSREEAVAKASALTGQAYGGTQDVLRYPGRAVMATPGAIGSAGSWFGKKLGEGWGYVAPNWANRASQYISENAYAPVANAFSANFWNPVANAFSENITQPLSETSAAELLAGMSDEQKQAAVGLAAVIAAGIAAKKGYDYWRGPNAYSQFKQAIDELMGSMLIAYTESPTAELDEKIRLGVNAYYDIIQDASGTMLSQSEAADLLQTLNTMKIQLGVISGIYKNIAGLHQGRYIWSVADSLRNKIDADPILTVEQKEILKNKTFYTRPTKGSQ